MPCRKTIFTSNHYYHVFNRGSEKRTIFQSHTDYNNFLKRLKEGLDKHSITLLSFSLLPNHFHFLLKQNSEISLAKFMNSLQLGYAKFFNTKYERVGPLFQGRFKAKLIESDEYLLHLSKYIHRNPLTIISKQNVSCYTNLTTYSYSSYQSYIKENGWPFVETETILSYFSKNNPLLSYKNFVEETKSDLNILAPLIIEC